MPVSTRRALKCIYRFLPDELLTEIIKLSDIREQAALCRVSRLFRALATKFLYTNISIEPRDDSVFEDIKDQDPGIEELVAFQSFSRTITKQANASLRDAVRHFHLRTMNQALLGENVVPVLKCLPRLECLELGLHSLKGALDLTFPDLLSLALITEDGNQLASLPDFLSRHQNLTHLTLVASSSLIPPPESPINVPKLESFFTTDLNYLPVILGAGQKLRKINFMFLTTRILEPEHLQDAFRAFDDAPAMESGSLAVLQLHDCIGLFASVPSGYEVLLPDIEYLHVYHDPGPTDFTDESNEFLDDLRQQCLVACMSKFQKLRVLELVVDGWTPEQPALKPVVSTWFKGCKSLQECEIGGHTFTRSAIEAYLETSQNIQEFLEDILCSSQ